ncbi:zinc metalloprotease [Trichophyton tonsurans CBS 112818]|uniref:Zinc metalloprotease n=1 Tax=Trichophyton tonsurans (strain CBS 112818) TaxID=647933 RepID=F2RZE3_TRIT1|nr:zinc metalloprotease [Trichophyton tonsurans CBS 112818]
MESRSSFRIVNRFIPDYSASVFTQYESQRTGMRVVTIDQKGPRVQGHFVLATEIHDDSGAPHTLEHLCFMGSRNYQDKAFLHKLSARLYSEINAWTTVDHTAYTLESAGWEAFAQLLPVYLEHIITPTLSDSSCYTEVYHIDGTGHDAGVVYSEMQSFQNDSLYRADICGRRLLYPAGVGFRYETGGMIENLRVLTPDQIREFHREMYQPKNLCLVITGEIDHKNLCEILHKLEDTIMDIIPSPSAHFVRPWIDSPQASPLQKSIVEKVEFPEDDESFGMIQIRFLGPDFKDRVLASALNVILLYLAGSSASILVHALVEEEQVTSAVTYDTEERPHTEITFTLSNVATEELEAVERRFFEILKNAMEREIDMKYMHNCIQHHQRIWKFATETSNTSFTEAVITDFLFGERDGSTLETLGTLEEYKILEKWTDLEWRDYIKKWISNANHVSVLAIPSAKMATDVMEDEHKRIEERKAELGQEGLKSLADALEKAKRDHVEEPSTDLMSGFTIPGTDSIHFIQTATAKAGYALKSKTTDSDGPELPLFVHFEGISSNFVQLILMISTEDVPHTLLPLLPLYTESFFSLPIKRGGEILSFERVVVDLEKDTVGYWMSQTYNNPESLSISLQVEANKYQAAISWLKDLAWNSIFAVDRLRAVTSKLLADVPEERRDGEGMVEAIGIMTHLGEKSISRAYTALVKGRYLKRVQKVLATQPDEVVRQMEEVRKSLFRAENFRVLVIADVKKLTGPVTSWRTFIADLDTSKELKPVVNVAERLSDAGRHLGKHTYVVPMKSMDSSYAESSSKGICSHDDPKLPALMVAVAYLNMEEGPMWKALRGTGLAYYFYLRTSIDSGLIHFMIHQSPNAYKAFEAAKTTVEDYLSGNMEVDSTKVLECAVSTLINQFATEKQTYYEAAFDSFVKDTILNLRSDYNEALLKKIRAIDMGQVKEAIHDFILPLFTAGMTDLFVTCAPAPKEVIHKGFESAGFQPKVRSLRDFEDDYGLKFDNNGQEDSDIEEDDDDDDDDDDNSEEDNDEDDEGEGDDEAS